MNFNLVVFVFHKSQVHYDTLEQRKYIYTCVIVYIKCVHVGKVHVAAMPNHSGKK